MWADLQFLKRRIYAPLPITPESKPCIAPVGGGQLPPEQQATVFEPEMLFHLAADLPARVQADIWDVLGAAAMQAMALGWARCRHVLRSRPIERTALVVWFRCALGKQGHRAGGRKAFDWCLPRDFGTLSAADVTWDVRPFALHPRHPRC